MGKVFTKRSMLNVWQGPEYASICILNFVISKTVVAHKTSFKIFLATKATYHLHAHDWKYSGNNFD